MTTGEQRQLLMIFTITAQCRSIGMITPSVNKNFMETKVHSSKTKIWAFYHIPRRLHHSKTNQQSGFNAEQIEKDRYLESKTI
jgi:hypothetical protein